MIIEDLDIFEKVRYHVSNMSTELARGKSIVPKEINEMDGWLIWRTQGGDTVRWVKCTDSTLVRFSNLKNAADVLEFARRYGVLGAKKLDPSTPNLPNELRLEESAGRWCVSTERAYPTDSEPIRIWLFLSRQLRALLRINAGLKGHSRDPNPVIGAEDDWIAVAGKGEPLTEVEDAQFFLNIVVNEWLRIGQVGLKLGIINWSRTRTDWKIEVGYGFEANYNLFGQLAFQLLLSITGEDRLYVCSGCGILYVRLKKQPLPGQDNYCEDCSEVASRRASQRWKLRNRRKPTTATSQAKK